MCLCVAAGVVRYECVAGKSTKVGGEMSTQAQFTDAATTWTHHDVFRFVYVVGHHLFSLRCAPRLFI